MAKKGTVVIDRVKLGGWIECPTCSATIRSNYLSIHERKEHADGKFISKIASKRRIANDRDVANLTESRKRDEANMFSSTFIPSNERAARDYVLMSNPGKKCSSFQIAEARTAYLETLEEFNLCRNCNCPIKARKVTVNGKIIDGKYSNGGTILVADVAAHIEVIYCETKRGLLYRNVKEKTIINSKCRCEYVAVRRMERKAKPTSVERPREILVNFEGNRRRH